MNNKSGLVPLILGGFLFVSATAASAGTLVNVSLWDKGAAMEMPKGLAYGMPMPDVSKATMGIKLSRRSAPSGAITFKVTNQSKDAIHELIVTTLQDATQPLAYIAKENRVDEDQVGDKGEVSELDPGKSGSLTVTLSPGRYMLICNVPGHFDAGMWTAFEVIK